MTYFNVDLNYFNHPKTRRLVGLLGKGSEVLPLKLWAYTGAFHFKDGNLTDYSAKAIEDLIGWWGEPGKAVEALMRVGFLLGTDDGYQVHEWDEHQGHIKMLHEKAKTAATERWAKQRLKESPDELAQAMLGQCPNQLTNKGIEIERSKAVAEALARINRVKPRLIEVFQRKPEAAWSYLEMSLLAEIGKRETCEAEFEELLAFRPSDAYFPQSVVGLLEGWTKTLDRARNQPSRSDSSRRGGSNGTNQSNRQQSNRNSNTSNAGKTGGYSAASARNRTAGTVSNPKQPDTGPHGH